MACGIAVECGGNLSMRECHVHVAAGMEVKTEAFPIHAEAKCSI